MITYIITWSITLVSYVFYKADFLTLDQLNLIFNFGALGPFLGAIISAKMFYGNKGVTKLFSTLKVKSINFKSVGIILSPLVFCAFGLLTYKLFAGHWYSFEDTKWQFGLSSTISYLSWFLPFVSYSVFEEFGWRGFLLPHLQSNYSALKSTIILTMVWASWHLPFFLWRFQFSPFITFGFFFSIFVGALIITALFNFSKGSTLAVILFHFCNNLLPLSINNILLRF